MTSLINIYKNKTVFVTGDSGFKGSWLSLFLLRLGAKVVGYSLPPRNKSEHFVRCGLSSDIRHIDANIVELRKLKKAVRDARPDFVYHLAAQPIVLDSYRFPKATFEVNLIGTLNLLEAIRSVSSVRSCVVVTTDKVYRNPEDRKPFQEGDPLGGHDPYSASKAGAEIVAQSYQHSFFNEHGKTAIATARSGNVIGGGDFAPYRIVPDCIRALKSGKPIVLRNPGFVRPWQHVLEPLHGYLLLGAALAKKGIKYAGAWNFGPYSRQARTVKELVAAIVSEWGRGRIKVSSQSNQKHEARYLRLNSNHAKKLLGWRPSIGFKKTVKQTVKEYREMPILKPAELFRSRLSTITKYLDEFYS